MGKPYKPGEQLPDGTIYVGRRTDGLHVITTPRMYSRAATFQTAQQIVKELTVHGHNDWVLPDDREDGAMLYRERNTGKLGGTFDRSEFPSERHELWIDVNGVAPCFQAFSSTFCTTAGKQASHASIFPWARPVEISIRPVRKCEYADL